MGQFAQVVEATGSGIALQRVHGTAHAANDFFIRWAGLELQARLVEQLQKLVGALKKERAELRAAIFRRTAHVLASRR